jgi:hypothetical protein
MTEPGSQKKIIVVSGATGHQGGSVIDGLTKDSRFLNNYVIRGITRDPDSPRCRSWEKLGVKFWKADLSNPSSLDEALTGASHFFMLTDAYDPTQYNEKELQVGKQLVDELIKKNVPNIIFSTLPNVEKISNGKCNVPFFTNKAKIEEYIRSNKDKFTTIQFVTPTFYFQNFFELGKLNSDGTELQFKLPLNPNTRIVAQDIHDLAKVVPEMILFPERTHGKIIPLVGEHLQIQEYVNLIGEVLGIRARFEGVTPDQYRKLNANFPMVEEWINMFSWFEEFGYFGHPPLEIEKIRELSGNNSLVFTTFRAWLQDNKRDPKWGVAQLQKESVGEKLKSGGTEEKSGARVQTGTG